MTGRRRPAEGRLPEPERSGSEPVGDLTRLDRPIQFLKGVGPRRADAFRKLALGTARDLLYHLPRRYDDASTLTPIDRLEVGSDATFVGRVRTRGVIPTRSGLRIFRSSQGWPGQAQVIIPESSWSTAWKMRSPARVGTTPMLRTLPIAEASSPTWSSRIGRMVDASS